MSNKFIVYLVSIVAFLGPFSQSIYTPMIPEVTSDFNTSLFMVNLTIATYTFVLAFMQMIYGPLTDRIGRKKVVLIGLAIYIIATIGCFFSYSITTLIIFRVIQAIGIAAGSVVAALVIGDLFEGEMRGKAMATFQMMVTLGSALGPVVGGLLGGIFDFHYVFLILIFIGLAVFLCNFLFLRETKPTTVTLSRFSFMDFFSILKNHVAAVIIFATLVKFFAYYIFLIFLPIILTESYQFTTQQRGLSLLPLTLSIIVGTLLGGRLVGRYKEKSLVVWTSFLNVIPILIFPIFVPFSLTLLISVTFLFGLLHGISLPAQLTMLTGQFEEKRGTAIGLYNFARYIGMGSGPILGTALFNVGGLIMLFMVTAILFCFCSFFMLKYFSVSGKQRVVHAEEF